MANPKKYRHLCGVVHVLYWLPPHEGRVGTSCLDHALRGEFGREFPGRPPTNRGLRRPAIRVITPIRADEASRVPRSTSSWRVGVQCGRSVRDSIGSVCAGAGEPGDLASRVGMEAGAPSDAHLRARQSAEAMGRRTGRAISRLRVASLGRLVILRGVRAARILCHSAGSSVLVTHPPARSTGC